MFESQDLHDQILLAINASENIISALQHGNIEEAERYDDVRTACFRAISRQHNFESMIRVYSSDIEKLTELDKTILFVSQKLRDDILTDISEEQKNRLRHVQYAQNQQL